MPIAGPPLGFSIIGFIIILASIGVITAKKPVHSCLSFLLTLLALASLYLELSAPFIAVMQVLVYAGAILVIFMFVIVLFQDAYLAIEEYPAKGRPFWITLSLIAFFAALALMSIQLQPLSYVQEALPAGYGSIQSLGKALYVDFFFPFEAVSMLFLVAMIGAFYVGKKR